MKIKRSELYERVWTKPVTRVARDLGVAERTLLTLCHRHRIPTPPRGYWRKVEAGQKVDATPLPDLGDASEIEFTNTPPVTTKSDSVLMIADRLSGKPASGATVRPERSTAMSPVIPQLDPSNPVAFVKSLGGREAASQFVAMLEQSARDCDSPTSSVVAAWAAVARTAIQHSNRLEEVLDSCRQIAHGKLNPEWWVAACSTGRQL